MKQFAPLNQFYQLLLLRINIFLMVESAHSVEHFKNNTLKQVCLLYKVEF